MHLHHRDTEVTEASIFDPIPTKAGLDQNSHPFGKGRNISCPKGAESLNLFRVVTRNKFRMTFSRRSLRSAVKSYLCFFLLFFVDAVTNWLESQPISPRGSPLSPFPRSTTKP